GSQQTTAFCSAKRYECLQKIARAHSGYFTYSISGQQINITGGIVAVQIIIQVNAKFAAAAADRKKLKRCALSRKSICMSISQVVICYRHAVGASAIGSARKLQSIICSE